MTIEIGHKHFKFLVGSINQFKIRHGPIYKLSKTYQTFIYASRYDSLFLLALSDTDISITN